MPDGAYTLAPVVLSAGNDFENYNDHGGNKTLLFDEPADAPVLQTAKGVERELRQGAARAGLPAVLSDKFFSGMALNMHLAAKKGKTFDKVECFNEGNGTGHRHENNHVNIQETACTKLNGEAQAHLTKIKGAYLALLNNSNLNVGPHRSLSPNAPSSRYTRRNVLLCRSSSPQPAHDMA
ncbi:unnamed protein product [Vitrella brassicaformis CCMP3155]|uniref:Uncharacterized protein n=1 Tax=Vitrella brassicaformis (strain CCMP3155) TaxID=1169540 RepID=A0A0G4GCZ7_VITBC|nr:unnamed protein product [Vitrella brassicaformis CCMP3155]|eukprot:CEM26745.1 unnamed protein product [Vitrella brassicaformis CCMP3155]